MRSGSTRAAKKASRKWQPSKTGSPIIRADCRARETVVETAGAAAACLFALARGGQLDAVQIIVAAVTLTLFLPCLANLLMMERDISREIHVVRAGPEPAAAGSGQILANNLE